MKLYAVQDEDGNIRGIYDEIHDAKDRQKELTDDGYEDVSLNDYLLNADVEIYDPTNVVAFKQ